MLGRKNSRVLRRLWVVFVCIFAPPLSATAVKEQLFHPLLSFRFYTQTSTHRRRRRREKEREREKSNLRLSHFPSFSLFHLPQKALNRFLLSLCRNSSWWWWWWFLSLRFVNIAGFLEFVEVFVIVIWWSFLLRKNFIRDFRFFFSFNEKLFCILWKICKT